MKIQVLQEDLDKALGLTTKFVQPRAQLPILNNVVFQAKKTKLSLLATNLEVSLATSIGAKVEKEGELAIPARIIHEIITNLVPGQINLKTTKEQLEIESSGFRSTLAGMNSADFPNIPQSVGKGSFKLPTTKFSRALNKVAFAASIDETRPILTGVLLLLEKGGLTLVATDGFRLSLKKLKLSQVKLAQKLVLPKASLLEFVRILTDSEENFQVLVKKDENQVIFGVGNTVLSSKVLEGDFPDYHKIIPSKTEVVVRVDREELKRALKLASVFARDSANMVKLEIGKNSLSLSAESSRSGSQKMDLDAKIEGPTLEIAYNFRFLEEFVNVVEGEEVEMKFVDSASPGVFLDPQDKDLLHLIMPVKLQE